MSKNVAAYCRVSTDGQTGEDKFGLESQRQMILDYCAAHDMIVVRWFADEGESGAKLRPGFDEIVYGSAVENPPYEAVVVAKSDRVARDINIYYYYKMMLRMKDLELISVAEDFGQMGVFSTMLEAFTMCCAQMERENIMKRTSAGRKIKASKGGYSGGKSPFGYRAVQGRLIVNEEEAEIVREIFAHKDLKLKDIKALLDTQGRKTRGGKEFAISTIAGILKNERTYRGEYRYGKDGEWVKGEQEAILEEVKSE